MIEPDPYEPRELRRNYHDRISAVRTWSGMVLAAAVEGIEAVTQALSATAPDPLAGGVRPVEDLVAAVDSEVVEILALQAPVARDLRLVLAARDVTTIGQLCVGLGRTLAGRVPSAGPVITSHLGSEVAAVGGATSGILRSAAASWAGLDADEARAVEQAASGVRLMHLGLLADLVGLRDVPMGAAIDLGMVARAFERLTDHAVEIAGRVLFATGDDRRPSGGEAAGDFPPSS